MINESQLKQTEFHRASYTLILEEDQNIEDLLDPKAWANVALKLRPLDQIFVFTNSADEYAELMVRQCDRLWAHVVILNQKTFEDKDEVQIDSDYFVKWNGPSDKYCVIRRKDNSKIKTGFAEKMDAEKSLIEHTKAISH